MVWRKLIALLLALTLMGSARAQSVYVAGNRMVDAQGRVLASGEAVFAVAEDALYAVGKPGAYALFDAAGTPLTDGAYEMLEAWGDVVLFRQGGLCGAMDMRGVTMIAPEWTQLVWAGEGSFLAIAGDPYDDQPDEMIHLTVDGHREPTGGFTALGLSPFSDGRMAFMLSDGQYGYVDAHGRQVIPPQWRYAGDFEDGAAIVSDGTGMGLIDPQGRALAAAEYAWIQRGEGLIAARTADGRLDVYSADGREKLYTPEPLCDAAEVCGGCVVLRDADAARLYDRGGACLCVASRAALFSPGLDGQVIVAEGEWGEACQHIINADGSVASENYQRLLPLTGGRYTFMTMDEGELGWDYDSIRWGLMDAGGKELLPADYVEIQACGDDRLMLTTEEAIVFADPDGQTITAWPFSDTEATSSGADA